MERNPSDPSTRAAAMPPKPAPDPKSAGKTSPASSGGRLTGSRARGLSLEDEEKKRKMIEAESSSSHDDAPNATTRPLPPRYPPFPSMPTKWEQYHTAVVDWKKERRKITKLAKASVHPKDIPTLRDEHRDLDTADAVVCDRDKTMLMHVAPSVVTILSTAPDGKLICQCTGIIIGYDEASKHGRILTSPSVLFSSMGELLDPIPKLSVCLPSVDKTIIEGHLLVFNLHYNFALLEIIADLPLQPPSFGSRPDYGQEVFVLARDGKLTLMARHGTILWMDYSTLWRNHCLFLSCDIPVGGTGGPVVDNDGNIIGMTFHHHPSPAVISIPTILTCIDMWTQFSRVARPVLSMELRAVKLLDLSLQEELSRDYNINRGFIVDLLDVDSSAEKLGIRRGDVIYFADQAGSTLPQLEDYLLSLGWKFLQGGSLVIDLKLEVHDLRSPSRGSIVFPLQFSDACEWESFCSNKKEKEKKAKEQNSSGRGRALKGTEQ